MHIPIATDVRPPRRRYYELLRYVAVLPCIIALPLFALTGWGLDAWALSAALLAVNIGVAVLFDWAARGRGQIAIVSMIGISLIIRAWIIFATLFVIAWTGHRELAIAAAGAFLVYFTFDMVGRSLSHVLSRDEEPALAPTSGGTA